MTIQVLHERFRTERLADRSARHLFDRCACHPARIVPGLTRWLHDLVENRCTRMSVIDARAHPSLQIQCSANSGRFRMRQHSTLD